MSGYPFLSGPSVMIPARASQDRYIARLKRRQAAILQLSSAVQHILESLGAEAYAEDLTKSLHELLGGDIDDAIAAAQAPYPKAPKPSVEDLERAARDRDFARDALAALDKMADEMPAATAEFMRTSQGPMLKNLLDQAEQRLSYIQAEIERPDDQDDKVRTVGTLCAGCRVIYAKQFPTVSELKTSLKSAGWGRDTDGDWICPKCVETQSKEKGF